MRLRSLVVGIVLASGRVHAQPALHINAAQEHVRTLQGALGDLPTAVDVALTKLAIDNIGADLEVRVELRAIISDEAGRILWSSTSKAKARGATRDRARLQHDALEAAAQQLAKLVRARVSVARSWKRSST